MTTSGTTTFELDVATIIETAARRARGSDLGMLSGQDAVNARNCMNMVLIDITNEGYALSQLEYHIVSLTQGTTTYTLPSNVLDVYNVVFAKYAGANADPTFNETALERIDLATYNNINNKEIQAYPSQYALDRATSTTTLYLYPTTTSDDDELRFWSFVRSDDVTGSAQTVDLNFRYTNCLIAGTAFYMCLEKPEPSEIYEARLARLKSDYGAAMDSAFGEDRDRASMYITPSFKGRR